MHILLNLVVKSSFKSLLALGIMLAFTIPGFSQQNQDYIRRNIDTSALNQMISEHAERQEAELQKAIEKAQREGWETGNLMGLDRRGNPIYVNPYNYDAANLTNTNDVWAASGLNTYGAGMTVGIWEPGETSGLSNWQPRVTHQDFSNGSGGSRVIITDFDNGSVSSHATHVAGTLVGLTPNGPPHPSIGMAPSATLRAYNTTYATVEMGGALNLYGMLVSNHSYGSQGGYLYEGTFSDCGICPDYKKWTWTGGSSQFSVNGDDPIFGEYSYSSRDYDEFCYYAIFHLPVIAAGNEHDDNPEEGTFADDEVRNGYGGSYVNYDEDIHPAGDGLQSTSITNYGVGTNVLTVGNMTKDLGINASSSRGATDDGRIKPDLCGIGTSLYSAESASDNAYGTKTGTSMATPNVTGSLVLLQDGYEKLNGGAGIYMRSSTLKALALHSATDKGNPGPDYTYGWGLLNTQTAANVIKGDMWVGGNSGHMIIEDVLTNNTTNFHHFNFSQASGLRVTLVYHDPVDLMSYTPLQNDIDIKLVRLSDNTVFYPFVLDPNNPNNNAYTGDNDRDNVKQILLTSGQTQAGLYKLEVWHDNASLWDGTPQLYSLIVSGLDQNCVYDIVHKQIDLAIGTYTAQNSIQSQAKLGASNSVVYKTTGQIRLVPGFHVESGSHFSTAEGTCN